MSKTQNMTEDNVTRIILGFFFPMLFSNALQQIYSVADTAIIGNGIGDNALAAVGNAATISLFIIGFLQGLTNGFSVVIAQDYGAQDYKKLRSSVTLSIKLCVIFSIILTAVSLIFLRKIFILMRTDALILDDSLIYGYIVFSGLIATTAYNMCSGILRALGDSKTPFMAIVVSSAVNILLDLIFIFVFRTGVGGAAIATVFSQMISVFICVIRLRKIEFINLHKNDFYTDTETYIKLLKNGLPMAFMNSITAVGCIIVQSFVNDLGADSTSAYSVCTRYLNLFMLPSVTVGFTISAFTGQNYGAKKYNRIKAGVKTGLIIAVVSYILLGALMLIFPDALAQFMLNGDTAVSYTCSYLKILGFSLIDLNFIFIFRSAVQGMGHPVTPMLSGFAEMILRIGAIIILLPKINFIATAYADIIAWIGALSLNMIAYFVLMKNKNNSTNDT